MILAGTGHRPPRLGLSYSEADRAKLADFIKPFLVQLRPGLVISGGAQGFDQALALASLELDIPYVIAAPFPSQESKWPEDAQAFYRELVSGAAEAIAICKAYSNKAFYLRDRYMVDRSTHVLALLDHNPEKSGTRITVEYAESVGRPVRNLWAEWAGGLGVSPRG